MYMKSWCLYAACSSPCQVNLLRRKLVSYPDPASHSSGWMTSPLRGGDVMLLWEAGSGYDTRNRQHSSKRFKHASVTRVTRTYLRSPCTHFKILFKLCASLNAKIHQTVPNHLLLVQLLQLWIPNCVSSLQSCTEVISSAGYCLPN